MRLFIQLPAYNEETCLAVTLRDLPHRIEGIDSIVVVVVDDGSSDDTCRVAMSHGARCVRHKRRRGLASAFNTGLDYCVRAGADIIVNIDADNQYCGSEIPQLIAPIVAGKADITIGDRRPHLCPHFSPVKRLLQYCGSLAVSVLARQHVPDAVSGFRAFSRDAAVGLAVVTSFSYTIETILQAAEKGMAIVFVRASTRACTRKSRLANSIVSFVAHSAVTLLRVYAMFRPLTVFGGISAVCIGVGMAPIMRFVWLFFHGHGDGHVQSLVLGGVCVLCGCMALCLGVIGDLVALNRRLLEMTLERVKRMECQKSSSSVPKAVDGATRKVQSEQGSFESCSHLVGRDQ